MIYLDNAATTLQKPPCVSEAVVKALGTLGNASRGAHTGTLDADRMIFGTREKIASLFHAASPERVVFTSNATEALNMAILGTLGAGDHVVTTVLEHNSVLRPLYRLEKERGVALSFVQADRLGNVALEDFERLIRPETKAIVCTHASNLTGNVLDIQRIGEIASSHDLLLIVDASQTAGVHDIDLREFNRAILCFTGHKSLMGPQGTGGLCIQGEVDIAPLKTGGTGVQSHLREQPKEYPTRLEAGTLNGHGIAGLSAALDFILENGTETIRKKEMSLSDLFYQEICAIPGVQILGDQESTCRCPIVTLNLGDMDSGKVADILMQEFGIAVRAGAHCAPLMHEALGTHRQGAVRFSFGYYNTMEEVWSAVGALTYMIT